MAFEVGGGGRARGRPPVRPVMNVTPLVDVVLVLLIIFMVVTPLLARKFWLSVPKKPDAAEPKPPEDGPPPVVLALGADGRLRLGPEEISDAELPGKLARVFAARGENVLFFDADGAAPFGRAMDVLDRARGGGALTIAVLTEPLKK